jgi:hypothetical protein
MGIAEERAAARINNLTEWGGYLGVAPLIACLAAVGLLPDYAARELAQRIALAWGAVTLASAGAVHLGLALAGRLALDARRLVAALVPAVLGAAGIVIGGQRGLALLVVGWGGFWLYEHRVLGSLLPEAYLNLRRQLTLATGILLAVTMFVSDTAGLT